MPTISQCSFARGRALVLCERGFPLDAIARWLDSEGYIAPDRTLGDWTRSVVSTLSEEARACAKQTSAAGEEECSPALLERHNRTLRRSAMEWRYGWRRSYSWRGSTDGVAAENEQFPRPREQRRCFLLLQGQVDVWGGAVAKLLQTGAGDFSVVEEVVVGLLVAVDLHVALVDVEKDPRGWDAKPPGDGADAAR